MRCLSIQLFIHIIIFDCSYSAICVLCGIFNCISLCILSFYSSTLNL